MSKKIFYDYKKATGICEEISGKIEEGLSLYDKVDDFEYDIGENWKCKTGDEVKEFVSNVKIKLLGKDGFYHKVLERNNTIVSGYFSEMETADNDYAERIKTSKV